jgi:hypothetical protein
MFGINVVVAVTLCLVAFANPKIFECSNEEGNSELLIHTGQCEKTYNKVINRDLEHIFVFHKTVVSHSSEHTWNIFTV